MARSTLVLAAALVLAGGAFDSPSFFVPGIALALLVAASWLWVRLAARGLRVEREPGPSSIVEGDPYPVEVLIDGGRLPLPGGRVVHPLGEGSVPAGIRGTRRVLVETRSPRRGRWRLEPPAVRLRDPLGLHEAEIKGERGDHLLVLPRVEPVVWEGQPGGGAAGGVDGVDGLATAGLDTRAINFEVDGLRPYRQGSPASRIHWPTVARIGEVLEHRLVAGGGSSPLVVLDSSAPAGEDALDRAVRAAASLCMHLARRGGCELLLSGERRRLQIDAQLRSWPRAHARLAVVEPGGPGPAIGRAPRSGEIFWVTAAGDVAREVRLLGAPRVCVVTPFPLPGTAVAFSVAGCQAQRLNGTTRRDRTVPKRTAAAT